MAELTVRELDGGITQYRVDNQTLLGLGNDTLTVHENGNGTLSVGQGNSQMGNFSNLEDRIQGAIRGLTHTTRNGMQVYEVPQDFIENLSQMAIAAPNTPAPERARPLGPEPQRAGPLPPRS